MKTYKNITDYINQTPKEFRSKLIEMRSLVRKLVPKGGETIKYGMPTITLEDKNFIHYAAMKSHLGFYPAPSGVEIYKAELEKKGIDYAKGCIRFVYDKPLPTSLISKIIRYRLKEEKGR